MFSLLGIYNTALNLFSHLCILLTARKVSCFSFFSLQFQLNFSYFLYFHLTIIMCYIIFRSEDDLHSVKITHEDPVTKVDKVQ